MAKSNGSSSVTSEQSSTGESRVYRQIQWLNLYLSPADKEAAKLFAANEDHFASCLSTVLADGYNISLSFSPATDSFVCTILGKSCGGPNEGWGMTSHAGNPYEALYRGLYKHCVIVGDSDYAELAQNEQRPLT